MKTLRILFTVLCAICLVLFVFLGTFVDWTVAFADLAIALLCFALMLVCKTKQEEAEQRKRDAARQEQKSPSEDAARQEQESPSEDAAQKNGKRD